MGLEKVNEGENLYNKGVFCEYHIVLLNPEVEAFREALGPGTTVSRK